MRPPTPRDARASHARSWAQHLPTLPAAMADFETRGFRLDDPLAREILEGHARAFLHGYDLARGCWRQPHEALAAVEAERRGFAYEGAAMLAAIVDTLTAGRAGALRTLLSGPGWGYRHLVHVGAGWMLGKARAGSPRQWALDPLLRWLALDGAGFCRTFFAPRRMPEALGAAPAPRRQVLAQGAGRALWFVHAAGVPALAERIAACPPALRPHLWSGVGLAATYAGPAPDAKALLEAAGGAAAHAGQGSIFGATARLAAGGVPEHTAVTLRALTGLDVATAARWADETARDLFAARQPLAGYLLWRRRLRERLAAPRATAAPAPRPRATTGRRTTVT